MTRAAGVVGRTHSALAGAASDARLAWSSKAWIAIGAFLFAALAPAIAPPGLGFERLAPGVYVALAAVGLGITVGLGGIPSLAQGAFVAVGAFAFGLLRARTGAPVVPAVLAATVTALLAGAVTGLVVARLRGALVAVTTWLLTWLAAFVLVEFPAVSGGARGLVLPLGSVGGLDLTPVVHYQLGLALLALTLLAYWAVARGPSGVALAALRQDSGAATALGVPVTRLRVGAFAASAAVAGLAGALAVDLAGIADSTSYGPLLSFELFVAVLLGGATSPVGGLAGVLVLGALTRLTSIGGLEGQTGNRLQTMFASLILLTLLGLGVRGLAPTVAELWSKRGRARPAAEAPPTRALEKPRAEAAGQPILQARGLVKRFGTVTAVDDVDLDLVPGTVYALVGPNGSGKTTVLKLVSGALLPDRGTIEFDGDHIEREPVRRRALRGVVGTLQATSVFTESTVLENVLVGIGLRQNYGGTFRTMFSTPRYRAESREAHARAHAALEQVGLDWAADAPATELSGFDRRLLMIASAIATSPRALLLDEPAAGAAPQDLERLADLLLRLRDGGLALLLIEHDLRLVNATADRLTVLVAGRVAASGRPDEVLRSAAVRDVYLGSHHTHD